MDFDEDTSFGTTQKSTSFGASQDETHFEEPPVAPLSASNSFSQSTDDVLGSHTSTQDYSNSGFGGLSSSYLRFNYQYHGKRACTRENENR